MGQAPALPLSRLVLGSFVIALTSAYGFTHYFTLSCLSALLVSCLVERAIQRWGSEWTTLGLSTLHAMFAVTLGLIRLFHHRSVLFCWTDLPLTHWYFFQLLYLFLTKGYFIVDLLLLFEPKRTADGGEVMMSASGPVASYGTLIRCVFGIHHIIPLVLFYDYELNPLTESLFTCLLISELPVLAVNFQTYQKLHKMQWLHTRMLTVTLMLLGFLYFRIYRYWVVFREEEAVDFGLTPHPSHTPEVSEHNTGRVMRLVIGMHLLFLLLLLFVGQITLSWIASFRVWTRARKG